MVIEAAEKVVEKDRVYWDIGEHDQNGVDVVDRREQKGIGCAIIFRVLVVFLRSNEAHLSTNSKERYAEVQSLSDDIFVFQ